MTADRPTQVGQYPRDGVPSSRNSNSDSKNAGELQVVIELWSPVLSTTHIFSINLRAFTSGCWAHAGPHFSHTDDAEPAPILPKGTWKPRKLFFFFGQTGHQTDLYTRSERITTNFYSKPSWPSPLSAASAAHQMPLWGFLQRNLIYPFHIIC